MDRSPACPAQTARASSPPSTPILVHASTLTVSGCTRQYHARQISCWAAPALVHSSRAAPHLRLSAGIHTAVCLDRSSLSWGTCCVRATPLVSQMLQMFFLQLTILDSADAHTDGREDGNKANKANAVERRNAEAAWHCLGLYACGSMHLPQTPVAPQLLNVVNAELRAPDSWIMCGPPHQPGTATPIHTRVTASMVGWQVHTRVMASLTQQGSPRPTSLHSQPRAFSTFTPPAPLPILWYI